MPAPQAILDKIAQFHDDRRRLLPSYNETEVRVHYINPLFEALGWDVTNALGRNEVKHEDRVDIRERDRLRAKAPDYGFYLDGRRRFFVEAKKPAVNLARDAAPAHQLRRYAWTAKLPLSVLTDFEELAVYDTRVRLRPDDSAAVARLRFWRYDDYAAAWDEIDALFGRDAVLAGSLERFAAAEGGRKGIGSRNVTSVDAEFLGQMDEWRDVLARAVANRNRLSQRDLNFAVQQILDRVIFLRIAEDRGIEPYGQLQDLAQGAGTYQRLFGLWARADARYNSGLFHFQHERPHDTPDMVTPGLTIDDRPLKDILRALYPPISPYAFEVFPADILGQVYEQFLGKVIRLTDGGHAKVEEKPEVRKAGGVYYTPTYIVDYIVRQTVGRLLEGHTPDPRGPASRLRVLDPACGSGSFLLGAYQYLLDWHLAGYLADARKWSNGRAATLHARADGSYALRLAERRRILLDNLYGVDIDAQAVEVTKLSLLLKVLEGAAEQLGPQAALLGERVLPDLDRNIKCGNSLIGPDFYNRPQPALLADDDLLRVNAFDWQTEFRDIMSNGGFDAVIGNPPWVSLTGKFRNDILTLQELEYLVKRFSGNTYMPNIYEYFVVQGLVLVSSGGYFSFVVPDRLGFNDQFIRLRRQILLETSILALQYKVPFPGITADTLIFVLRRDEPGPGHLITISEFDKSELQQPQQQFLENPSHKFDYVESGDVLRVTKAIEAANISMLGNLVDTTSGFGGKSTQITSSQINDKQIPILKGSSIGRYETRVVLWFEFKKSNITGRTTDRKKLGSIPKVLLRKTGNTIVATYDDSGIFPEQSLYFLFNKKTQEDYLYILALLNSRVLNYFYQARALTNKRSIAQVKKVDLDRLPIRTIDFTNPTDAALHTRLVALVQQMLDLHRRLPAEANPQMKTMLQRQIDATDRQIDRLVYALYGLTEEEIGIVEGGDRG